MATEWKFLRGFTKDECRRMTAETGNFIFGGAIYEEVAMKCPFCQSENVDVPTVDIGVGEQQCAAAGCMDCMSYQINPSELEDPEFMATLSEEERKVGWIKA